MAITLNEIKQELVNLMRSNDILSIGTRGVSTQQDTPTLSAAVDYTLATTPTLVKNIRSVTADPTPGTPEDISQVAGIADVDGFSITMTAINAGIVSEFIVARGDGAASSVFNIKIIQNAVTLADKNWAVEPNGQNYTVTLGIADYSSLIAVGTFSVVVTRVSGDVKVAQRASGNFTGTNFSYNSQILPGYTVQVGDSFQYVQKKKKTTKDLTGVALRNIVGTSLIKA